MARFLLRRLIFSVFAIFGATIMVFGVSRAIGDPRYLLAGDASFGMTPEQWEALGRKLHLDKPLVVQYGIWVYGVARGDMGESLFYHEPVARLIRQRLPNTLLLAAAAWLFATVVGVSMGVLSAVKRGTVWDYLGRGFALFGQATPGFWVGLMAIFFFSFKLGWLPSAGKGEGFAISNFILPAIVMGWTPAAGYLRLTRNAMLEVLDSQFVILARAKGVSNWIVIWKHAFRNALLAPITFSALILVGFATGAVIAEQIFSWPGIGRLVALAAQANDFPVVVGTTLLFVVMYVTVVFLLDVLYSIIDPRIRHGSSN